MKLSTTTSYPARLYGLKKAITWIAEAGYDAVDFSQFDEFIYKEKPDKSFCDELRKFTEDKGLIFNQSHAPFGSSFKDEEKTKERFNEITNAMRKASWLGIPNIIVHPCQHLPYNEEGNAELLFEYNMDFYNRLLPYCEEYGINVALENMWQRTGFINHSICSKPEEFIKYLDTLNSPFFVACLDIGHSALVREDTADFIKALGKDRLKCLHVHDVDGQNDSHTLPFYGEVNWQKVTAALKEIEYEGDLTFEADCFLENLPEELYLDGISYMEKVGRYLVSKINTK